MTRVGCKLVFTKLFADSAEREDYDASMRPNRIPT